jgi:hypothetical protein
MTLRRIQLSLLAVIFSTLFLGSGLTQSATRPSVAPDTAAAKASSAPANWTFEGCWTQFASGPCRDVFRDQQGGYWICRDCGTTGNPGPGKCNPISQATLASGFWCS